VFKSKLMKSAIVAVMATFAISSTIQSAPAATSTIELHISADTNIQTLWNTVFIPAFEKEYPNYKVNVTFDRNGLRETQLIARITAAKATRRDPQVDLIDGAAAVAVLSAANLLYRPSPTLMPNLKDVNKLLIKQAQGGIPYRASTVLLAYNSKTVTKVPKTLDELLAWIKANPGKFTYNVPSGGGSGNSFVQTVVDMNLTPEERVKMSLVEDKEIQKKWAKGLETLRELNKFTYGKNGTYPANNNATLNLLETGEVDMGTVWSDMFASRKAAGTMPAHIRVVPIKNPSLTGGPAVLGIPSNGKNRTGARLLANFVLSPAMQNAIMSGDLKGIPVLNGKRLDQKLFENFKDVDITDMRAPYFSVNNNELRSQWSLNVPGK
jgi:putative spermidine/putrescine transport system substrate-binding protein